MLKNNKGFLVIEVLIAGLIITSSIAATMYLFRVGYQHLERAEASDVISSKLPQAVNILKTSDIETKNGRETLGNGVELLWEARLLRSIRPVIVDQEVGASSQSPNELFLYRVNFRLAYKDAKRDYEISLFRHKRYAPLTEF